MDFTVLQEPLDQRPGLEPESRGEHRGGSGRRRLRVTGSGASQRPTLPKRPVLPKLPAVRRRAWIVGLAVAAGLFGGLLIAAGSHTVTWTAATTLEVRSGASRTGPGGADEAEELAITYAALMSSDQSLLNQIATDLQAPIATVQDGLAANAETGTALVQVQFTAPSADAAINGADDLADVVSGRTPAGSPIAGGSIAVVNRADFATRNASSPTAALMLGAFLGLLIGLGMAVVAERSDRRVDDLESLSDASGGRVTLWPGGLSPREISWALRRHGARIPLTVIPMRDREADAAEGIALELSGHVPAAVSPPLESEPWDMLLRESRVLLVVGPGERVTDVAEAVERLRLLELEPDWSVLVAREQRARDDH